MKEFAGILFTLKKRVQNIVENDLQYYKYTLFGFYDGLDINTVEKWYDLRPKGLQNRQLQVDMENPFMAQYTFRAILPPNREKLDKEGFDYGFWERFGKLNSQNQQEYQEYQKEVRTDYPLLCTAVLNFSQSFVKQQSDLADIMQAVRQRFKSNLKNMKIKLKDLHCAIFPLLGYSDCIILFLVNDINKAANIIEQFKKIRIQMQDGTEDIMVSNCYSICGVDKYFFNNIKEDTDKKVRVSIQIKLKPGISREIFIERLKETLKSDDISGNKVSKEFLEEISENVCVQYGNADCVLTTSQYLSQYLQWHKQEQIFSSDNDFFKNYIAEVKTSLYTKPEECEGTVKMQNYSICTTTQRTIKLNGWEECKRFLEKYKKQLEKYGIHSRNSRELHKVMKNFEIIAKTPHGFDVRKIIGDVFECFIKAFEIDDDVAEKAIIMEEREIALSKFLEHMKGLITDLIHSESSFLEGSPLTHATISSATKLLFAYSSMLQILTENLQQNEHFSFIVSSGGCDKTQVVDSFWFYEEQLDSNTFKPIIVIIPETSLYDVQGTLFRVLHEYFHFIGNRRRRERFGHIVNALANYIAGDISNEVFAEETLEFLENKITRYLARNEKMKVKQYIRGVYEEKKERVWEEIKEKIAENPKFEEYDKLIDEIKFYRTVMEREIFDIKKMYDLFCGTDNKVQNDIYKIVYENQRQMYAKIEEKLKELWEEEQKEKKVKIQMARNAIKSLMFGYDFESQNQEIKDRNLVRIIEEYFDDLFGNVMISENQMNIVYGELMDAILSTMSESFSDCCAVKTIGVKVEDFLLAFIYEAWDEEEAFPDTIEGILRIGADLKILYNIQGKLPKSVENKIIAKANIRKEQKYQYHNVEEMIKRIQWILEKYQEEESQWIAGEVEKYLEKCCNEKVIKKSKDLYELYKKSDMVKKKDAYEMVGNLIGLWKKLGDYR